MKDSNIKYNDEPVHYCTECLSLKILTLDGEDYCDSCGCTHIKTTHIVDWEKLYESKYNKKFISNGKKGT